ncbi:coagulation factor XIII A chain-like [Menidia menidia]
MSRASYKGRYPGPVAKSNLQVDFEDFQDFEPFEGRYEAGPRGLPPGGEPLAVVGVNMRQDFNEARHFTAEFQSRQLVVRRGQQFVLDVTFSRPLTPQDDFQLEFLIGADPSPNKGSHVVVTFGGRRGGGSLLSADPSPNKGSHVVVTFGGRRGGQWAGQVLEAQGVVASLGVTPHAKAIVGLYRTYVAVSTGNGLQRTEKDNATNLYLLFNPWCPEDEVFYPDEAGRWEYVMNQDGVIYQGSSQSVGQRNWIYGQFSENILDACIYILDVCQMPIQSRGNVIKIVRTASAMINSLDDQGVVVGNWSDDYSMGKPPTFWIGSVAILQKYLATGVPVCYGQCWVFAGVLCTFLRCLGIPGRVITNFNSAHDNNGDLLCELIFKADGVPDRRHTRDSIWNYHCWCEAFMVRVDLPPKYSGWQVVDATPQETSDGNYRCGPASVKAVKDGEICHPFDSGFVFAEVNSDIIYLKRDRYGTMTPFKVDESSVGELIVTKAVGSWGSEDVTLTYKYPQGSAEDERSMTTAEQYGCSRDHPELPESKLTVKIQVEPASVGDTVKVGVAFTNQGELDRTVRAHLEVSVAFYTGVVANSFRREDFTLKVEAFQTLVAPFEVSPQEYLALLGNKSALHFVVNGQSEGQDLSDVRVISLKTPGLSIQVDGPVRVNVDGFVVVTFRNPLDITLTNAQLIIEAAGLLKHRMFAYRAIHPGAEISQKVNFRPNKPGTRNIFAVLDCDNLNDIQASVEVHIEP